MKIVIIYIYNGFDPYFTLCSAYSQVLVKPTNKLKMHHLVSCVEFYAHAMDIRCYKMTHLTRLFTKDVVKTGTLESRLRQAELGTSLQIYAENQLVVYLDAFYRLQGAISIVDETA